MASCIRSDHRQAIHLLSTLLKHVSQGQHEAFQGQKHTQGPVPFELASHMVRVIDSTRDDPVVHRGGLLERRADQVRSKPLFNLQHKANKPTPFSRQSKLTTPPWVEPISRQRPRQRDIDPQARPSQSSLQSDSRCLPGSNPFRGKGPVKETSILKPIQGFNRDNKAST